MPIAKTFPAPIWSQAIGSRLDRYDSDWDNIDLEDGAWTRTGTNVTVAALAVDSTKKHTFTMTAIAVADSDYCPITGGNFTGDTWTKDLRMPDGTQIVGDDNFMLIMEGHIYDPGVDKEDIVVTWGLCGDPTTTVVNDRGAFSLLMWETSDAITLYAGGVQPRAWTVTDEDATMERVYGDFNFSKNTVGAGTFHTYDAADTTLGFGVRASNYTWTGNPDLKLCVQVGAKTNAETYVADKKIHVNMRYKLIKLSDLP